MAKKKSQSRRVPRTAAPRMYGDGKRSVVQPAQAGGVAPKASVSGVVARSTAVATDEYHYVVSDLRRLAILSAITFAVLIVLGLIIG